jgi:hypothetical protein
MKTKWSVKIPTKTAWYWVKYRGKRGIVICPAEAHIFPDSYLVITAKNDVFGETSEKEHRTGIQFGPKIPFPK